ncbi:MAG: hypothetical protein KHZ90_08310 [Veillonella parvula]|uniref:Uncharacterized protein n=1 Tax=Veillonella parvula TaxID=29466 RepID=A0A942WS13_VEIPA|nr:hypothetical protein [Veillonella parvula]MBS4893763.1 hypothetical protein [Veillonella parvula]
MLNLFDNILVYDAEDKEEYDVLLGYSKDGYYKCPNAPAIMFCKSTNPKDVRLNYLDKVDIVIK